MGFSFTIISLVALPIIIFIFMHTLFISLNPKHSKLPPGPKPWPIIGNIHLLGRKPHHSVSKLADLYGPIISLKLGSIQAIVISCPNIAREMFTKHDSVLAARPITDAARVACHDQHSLIALPICPKWKSLRKILTVHLFTHQRLNASQELRQKKVNELVEYVRRSCYKGEVIEIGKAVFTTSLNLLSNTFFSLDLCDYDSGYSSELKQLIWKLSIEGVRPNVSDFFPVLKGLDLQGVRRRVKVYFYQMWGVFEEIIEKRLRDSMGLKGDVLDTLLKLVEEEELSLDDVKHVIMDLFSAGTETTLITVEWAITELLRHPEKITKAQAEIDQITGKDGTVQESDISKLPYIQAIIKEIFRLHPPTPFLVPRKAEKEVELCDYHVPKDAQIWVNIWYIGRDPNIWSNPESFVPERFLGKEIDMRGQDFELMPFGSGRRICPGMSLGHRMVHLMLATLLHSFNWKLPCGMKPEDIDMEDKFGLTLRKAQPLQVIPHFR